MTDDTRSPAPETTPLDALHRELGGRMVPFAGYALPVQYPDGTLAEHRHTREKASLFDVSHMGQVRILGADVATAFESLVPGDIAGLASGEMRYTQFTDDAGGILDDLMVTRLADTLHVVVNAAVKTQDIAHMRAGLAGIRVDVLEDHAMLALQGPAAVGALAAIAPGAADLRFLQAAEMDLDGVPCLISRSGYTGEDGFEISLPAENAEALARRLLDHDDVAPAGLGARDTLRLEAGLCLYGHDITPATTPVEAGLTWSIGARRRDEGGFPGAKVVLEQIARGVARRRAGLTLEGRLPAREGAEIQDINGSPIGKVTSGSLGPTVGAPIAMGYVSRDQAKAGTEVQVVVRDRALPATVTRMPFVPAGYVRD